MNQFSTYWKDTSKVAKSLNISNQRLLQLLTSHGLIYKNTLNQKIASQAAIKQKLARFQERQWIYNGKDKQASQQQVYTVIQLSPKGIDYVRQQLANSSSIPPRAERGME